MKVKFNPEINIGHVVYIGMMLVGLAVGYGAFKANATQSEQQALDNRKRIEKLEDNAQKTALILREIMVRLNIKSTDKD
jgi:hypothetical protein